MESEIRRLLDKAEDLVERCIECGNLDCDECEEARDLLNEIESKINSLQDKKVARRLSVMLDELESRIENLE
ncbi:hypothetical protein [Saccharolobus caldissimus]|uniref:Uncharacterized protein n=1 Tax=Saccharolobus caldissimus TaxID=1702097 RepID=A0AAQ4CTK0_9CREN|nr:hypothetical protein [Saccharolobus caldissimus]BDB99131.1 hypothetical protein SACC_21480 [Saccharolobus caldissimus]